MHHSLSLVPSKKQHIPFSDLYKLFRQALASGNMAIVSGGMEMLWMYQVILCKKVQTHHVFPFPASPAPVSRCCPDQDASDVWQDPTVASKGPAVPQSVHVSVSGFLSPQRAHIHLCFGCVRCPGGHSRIHFGACECWTLGQLCVPFSLHLRRLLTAEEQTHSTPSVLRLRRSEKHTRSSAAAAGDH